MAGVHGVHGLWIPVEDGSKRCCCCGLNFGGETLECGCHYCDICIGRGHEEDHGTPEGHECDGGKTSPPFHRIDHDCPACGEKHFDWERCADLTRSYVKSKKLDVLTHMVIRNGVVQVAS